MSIKSEMLSLAGLYNESREIQLNEMGLREMNKDFKLNVRAAHTALNNENYNRMEEKLKAAVKIYIDKTATYANIKDFDYAAQTARRGWSKTSNNSKVKEIFMNNTELLKRFGNILMKTGKDTPESKIKQTRIHEKGKGVKTIFDPITGKKRQTNITTSGSSSKQSKIKGDLIKSTNIIEKERQKMLDDVRSGDIEKVKKVAKEVLNLWKEEDNTIRGDAKVISNFLKGKVEPGLAINILKKSLKSGGVVLEMLVRASVEGKGLNTEELSQEELIELEKKRDIIERRKKRKIKEDMNFKGGILAESIKYEGVYFWENYIFSNLLKRFAEDTSEYGINETIRMYSDLFGYETRPIWDSMGKNESILYEAYQIKDYLLFEGPPNASPFKTSNFLKGVWGKIKAFGAPVVEKLGGLLTKGVSWAKNILSGGIKFFTTNPIAKIAFPAVLAAGGVAAGITLINKLRKRARKKKMSEEELEELKRTLAEKQTELEKLKKKGIPGLNQIENEIENEIRKNPRIKISVD